jgi:hypothetical protein
MPHKYHNEFALLSICVPGLTIPGGTRYNEAHD